MGRKTSPNSFSCSRPLRGRESQGYFLPEEHRGELGEKQKTLRPKDRDERQTFRGTTRIRTNCTRSIPDNGGEAVPLSGAAPGRTKRTFLWGGFQPMTTPL